ncbi:Uncharacterised protein [Vibrio cholerae]|nr:Uncharacterised protein [Vibrio cholerae]
MLSLSRGCGLSPPKGSVITVIKSSLSILGLLMD